MKKKIILRILCAAMIICMAAAMPVLAENSATGGNDTEQATEENSGSESQSESETESEPESSEPAEEEEQTGNLPDSVIKGVKEYALIDNLSTTSNDTISKSGGAVSFNITTDDKNFNLTFTDNSTNSYGGAGYSKEPGSYKRIFPAALGNDSGDGGGTAA